MVEVGTPIIAVDTARWRRPPVQDAPAAGAVEPGIEGSPAPKMAAAAAAAERGGDRGGQDRRHHVDRSHRRPRRLRRQADRGQAPSPQGRGCRPRSRRPTLVGRGGTDVAVEPVELAAAAAPARPRRAARRALAKPPVRKYAKDLGIDLGPVAGSGEGGIISRADVDAHAAGVRRSRPRRRTGGRVAVPARRHTWHRCSAAAGERETRIPIKGVRKMTAQAMVGSAFTAPHVTEWVTIDATRHHGARRPAQEGPRVQGRQGHAAAGAGQGDDRRDPPPPRDQRDAGTRPPRRSWSRTTSTSASPPPPRAGLIVPNIKDADQMSMRQLAEAIGALTATAREGRTQPAEMSGGTITITNVGVFGVDTGTPIINPGEAAILAFGAIRRQPWVVTAADGTETIEPRWVTQLALSLRPPAGRRRARQQVHRRRRRDPGRPGARPRLGLSRRSRYAPPDAPGLSRAASSAVSGVVGAGYSSPRRVNDRSRSPVNHSDARLSERGGDQRVGQAGARARDLRADRLGDLAAPRRRWTPSGSRRARAEQPLPQQGEEQPDHDGVPGERGEREEQRGVCRAGHRAARRPRRPPGAGPSRRAPARRPGAAARRAPSWRPTRRRTC